MIDQPAPLPGGLSAELREDLIGRNSFVPVFVLTLLNVVLFPVADAYHWGFLLTMPLLAATILLALRRSHVRRHFLHAATGVVLVSAGVSLLTATVVAAGGLEDRWLTGITSVLIGGLVLLAQPAITREAFRHKKVSINTLAAGVTSYVFIGFFFATLFRLIQSVEGASFFNEDGLPLAGEFQYFSFVTLTTLGYGDYTPATDAGRAAAVLEAILGQVFLVTAVARIVSLMGRERPVAGSEEPAT